MLISAVDGPVFKPWLEQWRKEMYLNCFLVLWIEAKGDDLLYEFCSKRIQVAKIKERECLLPKAFLLERVN